MKIFACHKVGLVAMEAELFKYLAPLSQETLGLSQECRIKEGTVATPRSCFRISMKKTKKNLKGFV